MTIPGGGGKGVVHYASNFGVRSPYRNPDTDVKVGFWTIFGTGILALGVLAGQAIAPKAPFYNGLYLAKRKRRKRQSPQDANSTSGDKRRRERRSR